MITAIQLHYQSFSIERYNVVLSNQISHSLLWCRQEVRVAETHGQYHFAFDSINKKHGIREGQGKMQKTSQAILKKGTCFMYRSKAEVTYSTAIRYSLGLKPKCLQHPALCVMYNLPVSHKIYV